MPDTPGGHGEGGEKDAGPGESGEALSVAEAALYLGVPEQRLRHVLERGDGAAAPPEAGGTPAPVPDGAEGASSLAAQLASARETILRADQERAWAARALERAEAALERSEAAGERTRAERDAETGRLNDALVRAQDALAQALTALTQEQQRSRRLERTLFQTLPAPQTVLERQTAAQGPAELGGGAGAAAAQWDVPSERPLLSATPDPSLDDAPAAADGVPAAADGVMVERLAALLAAKGRLVDLAAQEREAAVVAAEESLQDVSVAEERLAAMAAAQARLAQRLAARSDRPAGFWAWLWAKLRD